MMYLAIHEVPCVGQVSNTYYADSDKVADDMAFCDSTKKHYVLGSYDLYRIVWNHEKASHELVKVEYIEEDEQ